MIGSGMELQIEGPAAEPELNLVIAQASQPASLVPSEVTLVLLQYVRGVPLTAKHSRKCMVAMRQVPTWSD